MASAPPTPHVPLMRLSSSSATVGAVERVRAVCRRYNVERLIAYDRYQTRYAQYYGR